MRNTKAYHLAVWGTVDKKQSPGKATWQVACKRCPWQGIVPSVTRIAQHISGSKSDVKACPSPDPELLKLVRDHEAAASPAGASSSRRRSGDDMEPSPSRLRATRNPSQEVVTKETIDDALTDLMTREWGVPLHILRGDGLARFCRLVGLYPGIYTPPSSEHMRTVLVRKAALRLDTELAPLRAERAVFGCGISFDGYTDESTRGRGQLASGGASRQQAGVQPGAAARRAAIAEAVAQAAAPKAVAPTDTVTAYKPLQLLNPGETRPWCVTRGGHSGKPLQTVQLDIRAAIVEHNIPNAEQILHAIGRRTSMLLRPLHGAAALLDPEYRQHFNMGGESSAGQLDFQAVLPDFIKVAEKLSPPSAAECVVQLPNYLHSTNALAAETAKSMPPHQWHRIHTGGALGALAMKVTSQVASATSCERAWSSYGFVHNPRRNRLTASNAEMLTQLYFNSRLLKRAGKGVASIAEEWQAEQGEGEREEEEGEGEEELLQRLQAVNDDALDIAVEADMAKVAARVAAQEAEALALALSLTAGEYFPCRVVVEDEDGLKPNTAYVFGYEPHSALPVGIPTVFATHSPLLPKQLQGNLVGAAGLRVMVQVVRDPGRFYLTHTSSHTPCRHGMASSVCFAVPFVRQLWWWLGLRPVSRQLMAGLLAAGKAVVLNPGGIQECMGMQHGSETVFLRKRHGFVRLAIQQGAPLVGAVPLAMWGVWGSPIPHQRPVTVVIGQPIQVPHQDHPAPELVQQYLDRFIHDMAALFERHKAACGQAGCELRIL
ncbi:hypothetical protein QJQ45_001587 [Haematococcus lacustris]|nr:hypothetical protein QJQ45_001587 [Haematococcus lacustris]